MIIYDYVHLPRSYHDRGGFIDLHIIHSRDSSMPAGVQATPTCRYIMCPVPTASVTNADTVQETAGDTMWPYINTVSDMQQVNRFSLKSPRNIGPKETFSTSAV